MATGAARKRPHGGGGRPAVVSKKRRKQMAVVYHIESEDSGDEEEQQQEVQDGEDFAPVNLADSDGDSDDIHNAAADDGALSEDEGSSSEEEDAAAQKQLLKKKGKKPAKEDDAEEQEDGDEAAADSDGEDGDDNSDDGNDDDDDGFGSDDSDGIPSSRTKSRSKRNDPSAFATSLSKILSTKLASTKRSDPVLSRSAAAAESACAVVNSTLEVRARRQIREHRRLALEKGRVRDVLVGAVATGKPTNKNKEEAEEGGAATVQETERRLRKTAQKGVVKLFNAVRAAQVAAGDAERTNKKSGVLGMGKREAKVQELSKKGFLDLIASGGGKAQKKGAIEEA